MLPQCSHITKKRGVYYYRRRIPKTPDGEIVLSLRTRSFREAECLAEGLDQEFKRLVQDVITTEGTDIAGLLREYLKRRLDFDMLRRAEAPHAPMFGSPQAGKPHANVDLEWIDHELAGARAELAARAYDHQRPLIDEMMETHKVPEEHRNALAHGILRANVELWETVRRRTLGEFPSINDIVAKAASATLPDNAAKEKNGPLFSEASRRFLTFAKNDRGLAGQTLAQNETSYRMFIAVCGDKCVDEYIGKDFTKFYDVLRELPKHYAKSKEWRGLSLTAIIERTKDVELERLTNKTVKRHFSALGSFYEWLKMRNDFDRNTPNPAYGFEFPTTGRARDNRKMWQGEPLAKLFSSPVWSGCFSKDRRSRPGKEVIKDEKYWLPLLGLYHGNRLEEFAQLQRGDVRCEDGIWFLDINDEDDKQLKNEQSRRRVPLHPRIQELGFIEYVNDIAADAKGRVFPELKPGGPDNKIGYYFTKWWTQYRKDVGVYEKGLDYHSFRGGVTTKLAAANISVDVRNELLGREGNTIDQQVYLKGLPLRMLADAIALVEWPELQIGTNVKASEFLDVA